jgi:transcriptional regulator with XRE-family HTH domain
MNGLFQIFATNLKAIRTQRKLTQEALAEKCGLSGRMIREVELANRAPSFGSIAKLCKALGVDAYEFFLPSKGAEGFNKRRLLTSVKADILKVLERHFDL